MLDQIKQSAQYIKEKIQQPVDTAIILGTGLGALAKKIDILDELPYESIPGFASSTVEGHSGKLLFGKLGGKHVLAMQGRLHYYEGYSMEQVVFPVRVMKYVGIKTLILSNAAGGLNPNFKLGDLMIINDHINFFPEHPLRGKNIEELGPRFPDMSQVYHPQLIDKVKKLAQRLHIPIQGGVYLGTSGPTFETVAEYNMFRIWGADAVGMSTVPEVIVAHHAGIHCFAISVITDSGVPGEIETVSHSLVQQIAQKSEPQLTQIITQLVLEIDTYKL